MHGATSHRISSDKPMCASPPPAHAGRSARRASPCHTLPAPCTSSPRFHTVWWRCDLIGQGFKIGINGPGPLAASSCGCGVQTGCQGRRNQRPFIEGKVCPTSRCSPCGGPVVSPTACSPRPGLSPQRYPCTVHGVHAQIHSTHGKFPDTVKATEGGLTVGGDVQLREKDRRRSRGWRCRLVESRASSPRWRMLCTRRPAPRRLSSRAFRRRAHVCDGWERPQVCGRDDKVKRRTPPTAPHFSR